MIYSELLKLFNGNVEGDANIDEILKGNEEIQKLFPKPTVDLNAVKDFLNNNDEGKQYLQSYGDKRVSEGIETFKNGKMKTIINDEVLKATGKKKTPEQIKMEELEKRLNEETATRVKAENTNKLKDMLSANGLDPVKTLEFFNVDDLEVAEKSIGNLKALLDEGVKAGVEEKIKSGNYTPPLNCGEGGDTGMSDADLLKIMG